jgi:hypothetical protein
LRLITNSNLVGMWTRRSPGFCSEDAIGILRRFAHYIFVVVTVGDESPGLASVRKELRNFAPDGSRSLKANAECWQQSLQNCSKAN